MAVVATPAYFAFHRKPKSPADLMQHRCIRARLPDGAACRWEFARQGESLHVDVSGHLIVDSPRQMHDAARAGRGLAQLAEWYVADHAPFKTTLQH